MTSRPFGNVYFSNCSFGMACAAALPAQTATEKAAASERVIFTAGFLLVDPRDHVHARTVRQEKRDERCPRSTRFPVIFNGYDFDFGTWERFRRPHAIR